MVRERFFICLILLVIVATSCEQRDPQAEFELLRETVYSSPQEGEETAQEYIDYFYKKKGARITEASEIRDQYRKMVIFFSISFSSYADFLSKSRELNYELSYSNYDGVRRMWLSHYETVKKRLLAPLMDSITASDFDSFFQEQVKLLCDNEFDSWTVEAIDQMSLSSPTFIDGVWQRSLQVNTEFIYVVILLGCLIRLVYLLRELLVLMKVVMSYLIEPVFHFLINQS